VPVARPIPRIAGRVRPMVDTDAPRQRLIDRYN
jgi:hypothetical protein